MNIRASPISTKARLPFGMIESSSFSGFSEFNKEASPGSDLLLYLEKYPWKLLDYPWMLDRCDWIRRLYPHLFRTSDLDGFRTRGRHIH